ncbi:MAG TPA: hypothetical protein VJT67_03940, partial [Longimicrobiaceae bacterium]|nr:hypothetical protein [Longimicrobiaceae bacterium]
KETKERQEESPRGDPRPGDYYIIETHLDMYFVDDETAVRVGAVLTRRFRPRWTRFVDLWGRRVWVRTEKIEAISESTGAQRERDRAFRYAQRRESRADRRWDDD